VGPQLHQQRHRLFSFLRGHLSSPSAGDLQGPATPRSQFAVQSSPVFSLTMRLNTGLDRTWTLSGSLGSDRKRFVVFRPKNKICRKCINLSSSTEEVVCSRRADRNCLALALSCTLQKCSYISDLRHVGGLLYRYNSRSQNDSYTWGNSDVISSTVITAAILAVYSVAAVYGITYVCLQTVACGVELHQSKYTVCE